MSVASAERAISVLLVDDDEDDLLLTRDMLRDIETPRFDVHWARTRREAEALVSEGPHDVYLLDYRLGDDNGLQVARTILDTQPHAPVIMISGYENREIDERAAELGIADYLVKGRLDPPTLERSIRYAVKHQRALRALADSEQRYALALAGANDGVWDWDLRSNTIYFSPRFKTMLGFEPLEAGEDPEIWFNRVHPDDRPGMETAIRAHLAGQTVNFESEHRIRGNDGRYRWMLSRGMAVRRADGRAERLTGSQTDITERKRAELQLQHDALHDALTGLPNRILFLDRLAHAMARDRRLAGTDRTAVLFLDLDRFKIVNDSLGHLVGDRLLVEVAERLTGELRPHDTVARLGGDEFVVLLEDLGGRREARRISDRVLDVLRTSFRVDGQEIYLSASIGIAVAAEGATPHEVVRDADAAMFRAKSEGRGGHAMFDTTLHEAAVARLELETKLRRGLVSETLADPGLQVAYQPIARARDGHLHGFEALARWREPDGEMVAPDRFIPVAEETGLINALGRMVLREACRQIAEWRALPGRSELTMAVNISGRQLLEPSFADEVENALEEHALAPTALRLEITETAAAADARAVHDALDALYVRTGVKAHLDDFGTGAASLTVLRGFPGDALKIDRSFVLAMGSDEGAFQIVRAVLALAHELGMAVVAEGVERPWQLQLLRELGCEFAQGYLLARPLAPCDAGDVLASGTVG